MSVRAAEMARILREEWWGTNESAESFAMRRFSDDKITDLALAVKILSELDEADLMTEEWFDAKDGR
jgi:hypothetical protein